MAAEMTQDEWRAFVSTGTRTAKLATTRPGGRAHVAPVWFVLDGDDVVFTTGADTVKGRNILGGAPVALTVDDQAPPYAFVVVEGLPEVSTDRDALLRWATDIGGRYMGTDRAEEFGQRNAVEGELLVRVRPSKVIAQRGVAE